MKIIVVEPLEAPYIQEIDGTLQSMQNIVGGLIEPIYINDVAIVVNEEGKLIGLPANRFVRRESWEDILCGTFFICYAPAESETFETLPPHLMHTYINKFNSLIVSI